MRATIIQMGHSRAHDQRLLTSYDYADAAFCFLKACLWNQQFISDDLKADCLELLKKYFDAYPNNERTLHALCERSLLARSFQPETSFEHPLAWLDVTTETGISGTLLLYKDLLYRRQAVPEFRLDTYTVATAFCEYVRIPSSSLVRDCEEALLKLKAFHVLQVFFRSIIYLNY